MDVTTGGQVKQDNSDIPGQDVQPIQRLEQIHAALTALQGSFDSKIRYDEAKEHQIAALHQELEAHRRGLYQQILRPVLIDVIGIYDVIANQAADESRDSGCGAGFLLEMVEGVLERYGVTGYRCEGDGIDRSRQRVIDVKPTGDPEFGKRLARRLRPGFELDGKVLRPEWVVAYRYTSGAEGQPED